MKPPLVYLVGTGPGDPELITVRGLTCLREADVVIHDDLVSPRLLRHARIGAEIINVGTAAPQPMAQEAINNALIEHARQGKSVVRLKGGDPYVFGRGMEELQALAEAGIPCPSSPASPAPSRSRARPASPSPTGAWPTSSPWSAAMSPPTTSAPWSTGRPWRS